MYSYLDYNTHEIRNSYNGFLNLIKIITDDDHGWRSLSLITVGDNAYMHYRIRISIGKSSNKH